MLDFTNHVTRPAPTGWRRPLRLSRILSPYHWPPETVLSVDWREWMSIRVTLRGKGRRNEREDGFSLKGRRACWDAPGGLGTGAGRGFVVPRNAGKGSLPDEGSGSGAGGGCVATAARLAGRWFLRSGWWWGWSRLGSAVPGLGELSGASVRPRLFAARAGAAPGSGGQACPGLRRRGPGRVSQPSCGPAALVRAEAQTPSRGSRLCSAIISLKQL